METVNAYPFARTNRPPTFLLIITGLLMLVGSLLMLLFGVYFIGRTTLTCTRQEPGQISCTEQETTWLGQRSQAMKLDQVQGIRLQTSDCTKSTYSAANNQWQDEASSCDATLIQTSTGDVYVPLPSSFYSPINAFIHSAQPKLTISDSHWGFASILTFFGLIGVLLSSILLDSCVLRHLQI